jgi:hypothetical protein
VGRRKKTPIANPFYAVLVVAGVIFFVTACAYGVMAFRAVSPRTQVAETAGHPLLRFLDDYGGRLLAAEVVVLALASFAAMGTDDYWTRRGEAPPGGNHDDDG